MSMIATINALIPAFLTCHMRSVDSAHASISMIYCTCMLFMSALLVSPTGRGWQPVQISSWWWCICWNETLSPAPASGGLYKPLCTSPSFLFFLRSRPKHTFYKSSIFPLSACFIYLELKSPHLFLRSARWTERFPQWRHACQDGPIGTWHLY